MKEYIEKETARAELIINDELYAADIVKAIPAADVVEVKHGQWIEEDGYQICSECGEEHHWIGYRASYCDVCGAKMDGGADDGRD